MWFVSHDRNSSVCLICIPDCVLTFRVCLSSRGHACEWPHGNNDHSLVFDLQWLPPSSKLGVETLPVDLVLIHNNGHSPFIFLCCVIVSVFVYLYLLYFGVHFNFSPLSWMIACHTTVELSKARVFKVLVFWKENQFMCTDWNWTTTLPPRQNTVGGSILRPTHTSIQNSYVFQLNHFISIKDVAICGLYHLTLLSRLSSSTLSLFDTQIPTIIRTITAMLTWDCFFLMLIQFWIKNVLRY